MPQDLNRLLAHLSAAYHDIAAWADDPNAGPLRACRARDAKFLAAAIANYNCAAFENRAA